MAKSRALGSGGLFCRRRRDCEGARHVLPALEFAEDDLAGGDQAVEQGECRVRRGKAALRLHPTPELQMKALDAVRRAPTLPLAPGVAEEGEQLGPRLLQTLGRPRAALVPLLEEGRVRAPRG